MAYYDKKIAAPTYNDASGVAHSVSKTIYIKKKWEDNATTTYMNTTHLLHQTEEDLPVWTIHTFASIVSLIALVYGISTWLVLPRSRTFHNYVYLNSIFALTLVLWLTFLSLIDILGDNAIYFILFFEFGFLSWVAVAFILIYRDIVIVFANDVSRKMLKCNLFAWGLPLATLTGLLSTGIYYFALWYALVLCVVLVVEVFLYVNVLYSLFKGSKVRGSVNNHCRRMQVATFTFFMGGIPIILEIAIAQQPLSMALSNGEVVSLLIEILLLTPTIVYNVFFIVMKSNRCLWREWRDRHKIILGKNVKTVCETHL